MTPGQSFAELFRSTDIMTLCLWATGFILFSVEFFRPMRGIMYATGILLICSAFITRMVHGTPGEAFMYILLTAVMMFAVHIVSLATQKRDWLRVSRIEKTDYRRKRYDTLIGRIGVANTPIDFTGNVTVDDINLVVYSESPIASGSRVRIVEVTPDKIVVVPMEKTDDIQP